MIVNKGEKGDRRVGAYVIGARRSVLGCEGRQKEAWDEISQI